MKVSQSHNRGTRHVSCALKLAALAGLGLALPQTSYAGQVFWADGADAENNWNEASNWSPATVPGAADFVILDNTDPAGKTALVNSDVPDVQTLYVQSGNVLRVESGGDLNVNNPDSAVGVVPNNDVDTNAGVVGVFDQGIRIGDGYLATSGGVGSAVVTGTGKLTMDSDNFASFMRVGVSGGTGTLTQDGGEITITRDMIVGDGASFNDGTSNISGAGSSGTFTQSGGTTTSGWGVIGANGGTGTYNLSAGTRTVNGWTAVGNAGGTGTFNMTGGTMVGNGDLVVGARGGNGTVNQSGGTASYGWTFIGRNDNGGGTGDYNLSGGSMSDSGRFHVGEGAGSVGTFDQSGGSLTQTVDGNGGWGFVGTGGAQGTYNQTGGTVSTAAWIRVGNGTGSQGTYNLSNNATLTVGTGSGDVGEDILYIGVGGGTGTLDIKDTATVNTRALIVGEEGGNGTVTQSGGAVNVSEVFMGIRLNNVPGTASYTLDGGSVGTALDFTVASGASSTATLNINNVNGNVATNVNVGDDLFVGIGSGGNGTVNQTGGILRLGTVTNTDTDAATVGSLFLAGSSSTGSYTLSGGVIDGNGGTFTGGATPTSRTFNFTGGRIEDVSAIGSATVAFPIDQQGGTLAPGASPGITTIFGNGTNAYTLGAAGTLEIEINGLLAGTEHDQLIVNNGLVSLAGNLDLIAGAGLTPGEYLILLNDSTDAIAGMFAGRADDSMFIEDGYEFTINYQGGDGNDVSLTLVPEPTSLALLGIGAMGLLARRRRNSAA